MMNLVWLLLLLLGCQQDEIVFRTVHKNSIIQKSEVIPYLVQDSKKEEIKRDEKAKCGNGCPKGEKCVGGICTKEALTGSKETFSDLLKRGESVGFMPGVTHTDYGGDNRFSPEEY